MSFAGIPQAQTGAKLTLPHLRELGERHVERADHAQEIQEADVGLAALDRADVVAVHVGAQAHALLTQAAAGAQLAYGATECKDGVVVSGESLAAHEAYQL